ncbi:MULTISPECIES: hypothetical protein [Psychrobacter]|uniref:hypothetical protein n=1 Tax=Psychrobacter TaxID=497 RepID=UPI001D0FF46B|nr:MULTISPECIES: hypothetical protein [Psychrobacter]
MNTFIKTAAFTRTATLTATLAVAMALSACQTTTLSPVIQRADSTYETTGISDTKAKAQQNALDSAKKNCGSRQVIIVDDEAKYNGILGERTGRVIGQIGGVLGGVLGTGSPDLSRNDDYEYKINFRCQ